MVFQVSKNLVLKFWKLQFSLILSQNNQVRQRQKGTLSSVTECSISNPHGERPEVQAVRGQGPGRDQLGGVVP